eukprot:UN04528
MCVMNKMSISHFNGKAKHQIAWAAHLSINISVMFNKLHYHLESERRAVTNVSRTVMSV